MSDIGDWLDQVGAEVIRTESVGLDGVLIGKWLTRKKFEKALGAGVAMTDFVFGLDIANSPYFGWWGEWRAPFAGDILQRPDPSTLVLVPGQPGKAACLSDFTQVTGEPLPVCPRSLARRLVAEVAARGYTVQAAGEIEFVAFEEPLAVVRARRYRGLTPLGGAPAPAPYGLTRLARAAPLLDETRRRLDAMAIPWEAMSTEAAPGQFEVNLEPADPVVMADRMVRVRQILREVAEELGHTVSYMAKLAPGWGGGTHLHHSLWREGANAFFDESAGGRSVLMRQWLAGLMATLPGAVSLLAPTVNSYRRFTGFAAAPTTQTWCEENKSTAIRTISRSGATCRIEHRVAASDVNPYLLVAAVLAGGLVGLDVGEEPPDESSFFAWGVPDKIPALPASIDAAADAFEADPRLTATLGAAFADHWVHTRRWEWLMYQTTGGDPAATETTQWELDRYFETV